MNASAIGWKRSWHVTAIFRALAAFPVLVVLLVFAPGAQCQPVRVMTEFARFTPTGDLFPQDGITQPVEVLSPPLVRGVWNAFRIVVDVEPGQHFRLFVGQNPSRAMRVRALREIVEERDGVWEIGRRELVLLPFRSESLRAAERPATRTTYTFWLEVQPPVNYRPRRLKLEAQVLIDDQWFIYPMEIRVLDMSIDLRELPSATIATGRAETPVLVPDQGYEELFTKALCSGTDSSFQSSWQPGARTEKHAGREGYAVSVLARSLDHLAERRGKEDIDQIILDILRIEDRQHWCEAPRFPRDRYGVEWPSVVRNRLLQLAGDPDD